MQPVEKHAPITMSLDSDFALDIHTTLALSSKLNLNKN